MASKDNSPVISFFSFQDIITSITGIMFLVVIMLVLMVLWRDPSSASRQRSDELRKELTELRQNIRQTRELLDELRRHSAEQNRRIEELKAMRPETLPELKDKWIRQLQDDDDSLRQLEDDIAMTERRRQELAELKRKNEILIETKRDTVAELRREAVALDDEIKRKEQIYNRIKNVVRFVWDRSNPKRPILLECSDREISVNSIDDGSKRRVFSNFRECMNYCRTFPRDTTYFILLIKPSAFSYAEDFSKELQKAGYERGREVLPDEQILVTGEARK